MKIAFLLLPRYRIMICRSLDQKLYYARLVMSVWIICGRYQHIRYTHQNKFILCRKDIMFKRHKRLILMIIQESEVPYFNKSSNK